MRAYEKAKPYAKFCREQVKSGKINLADGTWRALDQGLSMDRDCYCGYKLNLK
jgi:hypothetical protein